MSINKSINDFLLTTKQFFFLFIFIFIFFQDSLYAKSPVYNGNSVEYDAVLNNYDFNNPYNAKTLSDTNSEDLCVESDKGDGSFDCVQPNKPSCCPKGYTLYVGYDACKAQYEEGNENSCNVSEFDYEDNIIKAKVTCCVQRGNDESDSSSNSSVSSSIEKSYSSKSSIKSKSSKRAKKSSFSSSLSTSSVSNSSKNTTKSSSKSKVQSKSSVKSSKSSIKSSSSKRAKKSSFSSSLSTSNSSIAKVVSSTSKNSKYSSQSLNRRSLNLLVKERIDNSLRAQMNIDYISNNRASTGNMYNNSVEKILKCNVRGPIIDEETKEYKQGYKKCKNGKNFRCNFCIYRDLAEDTGKKCTCEHLNCLDGEILYNCSEKCSRELNFNECYYNCVTSRRKREGEYDNIFGSVSEDKIDAARGCRCQYDNNGECRHEWEYKCLNQDSSEYDINSHIPSSAIIKDAKNKSQSYLWLYVDEMGEYINNLSKILECDEVTVSTSDHSADWISKEYINLLSKCNGTNVCEINNLGCSTLCSNSDEGCLNRLGEGNINTNVCNPVNDNNERNLNSNNSNDSNNSDDNNHNNNNNDDACSNLRKKIEEAKGRKLEPEETVKIKGNSVTGFGNFSTGTPFYTIIVSSDKCEFIKPTCEDWIENPCHNSAMQDVPRCVHDNGKEDCLKCSDSGRWSIGDCLKTCDEALKDTKCGETVGCYKDGYFNNVKSINGCPSCEDAKKVGKCGEYIRCNDNGDYSEGTLNSVCPGCNNSVHHVCAPDKGGCDYDCFDPDKKACVKRKCDDRGLFGEVQSGHY